jgi:hypothetical protein
MVKESKPFTVLRCVDVRQRNSIIVKILSQHKRNFREIKVLGYGFEEDRQLPEIGFRCRACDLFPFPWMFLGDRKPIILSYPWQCSGTTYWWREFPFPSYRVLGWIKPVFISLSGATEPPSPSVFLLPWKPPSTFWYPGPPTQICFIYLD